MKIESHHIKFMSDQFKLSGILHLPTVKNPPLVVGSHGLEGSKESAKQRVLARKLPECGIAFFRFDHRGCGQSEGTFVHDTSLEKRSSDLENAVMHILSLEKTSCKVALFGSSMGGAACIHAWPAIEKKNVFLGGVVICSAPVKSRSIVNIPLEAANGRPALDLDFFKKNLLFDITEKTAKLHHVLIFHGDADEIVPVQNAHDIYAGASSPKRLIIQKDGRHQMISAAQRAEFEQLAPEWFIDCLVKD